MVPTKFWAVGTGVARLEIAPIGSAVTRMTRGLTGKVDDELALVVPVRRTTMAGKILRYPQ